MTQPPRDNPDDPKPCGGRRYPDGPDGTASRAGARCEVQALFRSPFDGLAHREETAIAQEVAKAAPASASVVKAFNTVFRHVLQKGRPDVFLAGDDAQAKASALVFIESLGLRPLDVGGLKMAHWLEGAGVATVGLANHGVGNLHFALSVTDFLPEQTLMRPNRALAQGRAPVERGTARLKSRQIFRRPRISPNRMHEAVLHRLDDASLIDVTRVVLDTAHVRAKRGGERTGPSPVDRGKPGSKMHVLSDANGLPLLVGVSVGNTHDRRLKPMVEGHRTRHDPHRGRYFKPQRLHADKAHDPADLHSDSEASASASVSPARAPSPASD